MSGLQTKLHEVMGNIRPKFVKFTVTPVMQAVYLTVLDNPVFVDASLVAGEIYLPNVAEAEAVGLPVTIVKTDAETNIVTIKSIGEVRVAINKADLDAALDSATYHPDGEMWHLIHDGVA